MAEQRNVIETKLAEFTEIHGTVLLGMHRELKTNIQKVDNRIEARTQELRDYVDEVNASLEIKNKSIMDGFKDLTQQIDQFAKNVEQSEEHIVAFVKSHVTVLEEKIQFTINQSEEHLICVTKSLDSALEGYQERLKKSETDILSFVEWKQKVLNDQAMSLDKQCFEIKTLNNTTLKMIDELKMKTLEHQRREADLNKRYRQFIIAAAVITCVFVVLGAYGIWIN